MYLEIKKTHKSNKGRILTICNYGYFRKNKEWEAVALNLFGYTFFLFRKKRYKMEWPVACG